VICDDVNQQQPQDPFHLIVDATLGVLVVDGNSKQVEALATCATTTVGQPISMNGNFDGPRGIVLDPTGAIYVSDTNRDRVSLVNRTTGAVTPFASGLNNPYGLEWLAGGPSSFADSLLVADSGNRLVVSTKGVTPLAVAYLRNNPIDLSLLGGTLYIVTSPSANNRGRIYTVTGF
jgi:DNA-binding beta-propeller fold protein YncE